MFAQDTFGQQDHQNIHLLKLNDYVKFHEIDGHDESKYDEITTKFRLSLMAKLDCGSIT